MSSQTSASSDASNATVRRSFTLPARIASKSSPPAPTSPADGIETLFVCASAKIVSFTAPGSARRASPSRRRDANAGDAPPSIPWRSATDRTLAFGPLRIYRVTSSNVSFLNSGNLLHTIFPRSQCWCVDGESIFVLRIRQDTYYRIELPYETTEDKEKVEHFKRVLPHVLQYERTPCPFARGFEVQLPERPQTPPRRLRPKKPTERAKKWTFDKTWMPENGSRPCTPVLEGSDAGTVSSYEDDDASSICTESELVSDSPATLLETTPPKPVPKPARAPQLSISERARMFQDTRSATAPINHRSSISSKAIPEEVAQEFAGHEVGQTEASSLAKPPVEKDATDAQSVVSTVDTFYSFDTSAQRSPTAPFLDAETESANPWAEELGNAEEEGRGRSKHRRQTSEMTVRQPSAHTDGAALVTSTDNEPITTPTVEVHLSQAPSTPPLISDSDDDSLSLPSLDVATPPDAIRMKRLTGASQKRAFSPMPHPQNLFRPPSHGPRNQFTRTLIRKTAEIVLGPPSHLVQLMLRIAAKISDGVFSFKTYRIRNNSKNIPGSWLSDEEDWAEEDDFGIPLRTLDEPASRRRGYTGDHD